ncbi:hypothetical protein VTH06DRAFT_535 [Thermothelomyces fergusii]
MRDAVPGALLDMYASSLRRAARNRGGNGAECGPLRSCRRLLSSHIAPPSPPPHYSHRRRPPAPTAAPLLFPSFLSPPSPLPSPSPSPSPHSRSQQRRHYALGNKHHPPQSIAVLGGGLTGLTTAWYLTRFLPEARITIYEADKRLGGWIQTDKAEVTTPDGTVGTVHFERAARMVKPQSFPSRVPRWDDLVFYDLVTKLDLADQLVCVKEVEEAISGFIYYPDHLVPLPKVIIRPSDPLGALRQLAGLARLLFEPVFRDLLPAIPNLFRTRNDPLKDDLFHGRRDVSVGEYYARRLGGPAMVDKVLSAMIHGITGGDVWEMSMGSGFLADQLVPIEDEPITNVRVRSADYETMLQLARDRAVFDLAARHLDSSAVWFRNGFATLTDALAAALRENPNVTVLTGTPVTRLEYVEDADKVAVHSEGSVEESPILYDKVVSTIFARTLHDITDGRLPSLLPSPAVSIMLVNIWYPVPRANFPHHGFGYLVPQALPFEQNPECVLGVIFDSDREFPLPNPAEPDPDPRGADTVRGTKLTVMMGGHYYADWPPHALPHARRAEEAALAAVERHLRLPPELAAQARASAKLCRDCIPQHVVGHAARMRAAHAELDLAFRGRLAVAGQSYQNPGVLNMLRAARDVAVQIAGREDPAAAHWSVGDTGLERFTRPPTYRSLQRHLLPLRYGSPAFVDETGRVRLREREDADADDE